MPVAPTTPLSLIASVNLHHLREAFDELEKNHGFYVDTGAWCCRTCGSADAWEEGPGKPFVFWHEQGEDRLHSDESFEMPLYFGVAKEDANNDEKLVSARKIIDVLEEHDFNCRWKDGNLQIAIMVQLDTHKPCLDGEDPDHQSVDLFVPKNEDTKDFCWNESEEDLDQPEGTFNFNQEINDGESLKDAILRLDPKVWRHITHYQRIIDVGWCGHPVETVLEIDQAGGHAGSGESLLDVLTQEKDQ